jgi:hypothetical protein
MKTAPLILSRRRSVPAFLAGTMVLAPATVSAAATAS